FRGCSDQACVSRRLGLARLCRLAGPRGLRLADEDDVALDQILDFRRPRLLRPQIGDVEPRRHLQSLVRRRDQEGRGVNLDLGGLRHAPGTGLAVKKLWTIEVATTLTKRANSPSRTANCDLSSLASYSSTRGSPSLVSAGSYFSPRSMVTRPLASSRASQRTRMGTAGGPSRPLRYMG